MTGAYGVFANNGDRNPTTFILSIKDSAGKILEEYSENTDREVIQKNAALQINDILSDNVARTPLYDTTSPLYFPGRQVAVKTGTTNDYRDAWIIGYTPSFVLGVWAGNNDNTPMEKKISGFIVAPMWNEIMQAGLKKIPVETFEKAIPTPIDIKPILAGNWNTGGAHTILAFVDKDNPLGPTPENPASDSQYWLWEIPIRRWADENYTGGYFAPTVSKAPEPSASANPVPVVSITSPANGSTFSPNKRVDITISASGKFPLTKAEFYVNDILIGMSPLEPFSFSFVPQNITGIKETNQFKVIVYDFMNSKTTKTSTFQVGN
jgi:membrane peptidoglycan carboxypeptidase